MLAPRAGCDVDELTWPGRNNAMPDAARYDDGLAGSELDRALRPRLFKENRDVSGDEKEQFVAVGMHLAEVGSGTRHQGSAYREALDPRRRSHDIFDEVSVAVTVKTDDDLREIEGRCDFAGHGTSLHHAARLYHGSIAASGQLTARPARCTASSSARG